MVFDQCISANFYLLKLGIILLTLAISCLWMNLVLFLRLLGLKIPEIGIGAIPLQMPVACGNELELSVPTRAHLQLIPLQF